MCVFVGCSAYGSECHLKGGYEDSHCHEYVPWTSRDPQWRGSSGPAVCAGGAGWKLLFRQTYPYTYHKSSNALNHNERDPSSPDCALFSIEES